MKKTNVMRILDSKKVDYDQYLYNFEEKSENDLTGDLIGVDNTIVYKTLVTTSKDNNYVFVIPIVKELDLKKAAKCVNEKKIEMIKQKELLPLTGYVHGGCSPVGMKKQFITVFDDSINSKEEIVFNGGQVGSQIKIKTEDIKKIIDYKVCNVTDN